MPRVSVIMPVFNARPFLGDAIESLRVQQWPDLELIAVDDGSTDGSAEELVRLWPAATVLAQRNRGPAAARNAGLRQATGDYLAFLDADDVWPEGKLAYQVSRLEADATIGASLGLMQPFTEQASASGQVARTWSPAYFLFLLGGMVARPEVFREIGDFDEARFPFNGEDTDWFFRAWESARRMEFCNRTTIFYRLRPGSLTAGKDMAEKGVAKVLKASIDRRRHGAATAALPSSFYRPPEPGSPKTE